MPYRYTHTDLQNLFSLVPPNKSGTNNMRMYVFYAISFLPNLFAVQGQISHYQRGTSRCTVENSCILTTEESRLEDEIISALHALGCLLDKTLGWMKELICYDFKIISCLSSRTGKC